MSNRKPMKKPEQVYHLLPIGDKEIICEVCGKKKTMAVDVLGVTKYMPAKCDCEMKEYEEAVALRESKEKQIRLDKLRNFSLMDKRFETCTFANWSRGDDKLKKFAEKYVATWKENKKDNLGIMLEGPVGTGKTYTVFAIANALMENGVPVIAVSMMGLLSKIKQGFTRYGDQGGEDVLSNLRNADLLIIDDLGAEYLTDWAKGIFYEVIDERYRQEKPLIVTTNIELKKLKERLAVEGIDRIYDRIREMTKAISVAGKSIRAEKGEEKNKIFEERFKDVLQGDEDNG